MSDNTPTREILKARDHSQPCEHVERMIPTYRDAFGIDYPEGATIRCPWDGSCPGGREIVLRYEFIPMNTSFPINREVWVVEVEHE